MNVYYSIEVSCIRVQYIPDMLRTFSQTINSRQTIIKTFLHILYLARAF